MKAIFTKIYDKNEWGNGSGGGSTYEFNKDVYIPRMREFLKENVIKQVTDLGCGDWQCTRHIYDGLDIAYLGVDCVQSVIDENTRNHPEYKFECRDVFGEIEDICDSEMYVLKDVIQHWSNKSVEEFMDKLMKKNFKYVVLVNCCGQHSDGQDTGDGQGRPLSANFYPLKKYNPKILFTYNGKEVSVITKN